MPCIGNNNKPYYRWLLGHVKRRGRVVMFIPYLSRKNTFLYVLIAPLMHDSNHLLLEKRVVFSDVFCVSMPQQQKKGSLPSTTTITDRKKT